MRRHLGSSGSRPGSAPAGPPASPAPVATRSARPQSWCRGSQPSRRAEHPEGVLQDERGPLTGGEALHRRHDGQPQVLLALEAAVGRGRARGCEPRNVQVGAAPRRGPPGRRSAAAGPPATPAGPAARRGSCRRSWRSGTATSATSQRRVEPLRSPPRPQHRFLDGVLGVVRRPEHAVAVRRAARGGAPRAADRDPAITDASWPSSAVRYHDHREKDTTMTSFGIAIPQTVEGGQLRPGGHAVVPAPRRGARLRERLDPGADHRRHAGARRRWRPWPTPRPARTRMRLGCAVLISSLHSPLHLAKSIATLDQLSGGRLEVGLAPAAASACSVRSASTAPRSSPASTRAWPLMRRLWTEDRVDYDGRFFQLHRRGDGAQARPAAGARRSGSAATRRRRCAGPSPTPTASSAPAPRRRPRSPSRCAFVRGALDDAGTRPGRLPHRQARLPHRRRRPGPGAPPDGRGPPPAVRLLRPARPHPGRRDRPARRRRRAACRR